MRDKLPSPKYLNILLVFQLGFHFVLPVTRVISSPWSYLGVIIIFLSLALNLWTVRQLKKEATIDFFEIPKRLETGGVFRISRNPVYLSGVTLSLGIAILLGSLITFVFPVALWLILDRLYIPAEEAGLERIFGHEYLQYKEKVRRWI